MLSSETFYLQRLARCVTQHSCKCHGGAAGTLFPGRSLGGQALLPRCRPVPSLPGAVTRARRGAAAISGRRQRKRPRLRPGRCGQGRHGAGAGGRAAAAAAAAGRRGAAGDLPAVPALLLPPAGAGHRHPPPQPVTLLLGVGGGAGRGRRGAFSRSGFSFPCVCKVSSCFDDLLVVRGWGRHLLLFLGTGLPSA